MRQWLTTFLLLAVGVLGASTRAHASEGASAGSSPIADTIREFLVQELAHTQPALRPDIAITENAALARLAQCERMEAFLNPGTRLWGHAFVGVRCLVRPNWSVSVPVSIRLYGKALVATQTVPALVPIPAGAVKIEDTELTRDPGPVATSPVELEDRFCTRLIEVGQVIPLSALRTIPAVGQGDTVKLLGIGNGFSISTDAVALASAGAGETVRVRTDAGRTLSGIARHGRVVEMTF
jgi:flagellar basal body P-ring formation protein FlgA